MKKKLLTTSMLVLLGHSYAYSQYIGNDAYVMVGEGALMVNSGLSFRTVGTGVLDIYGNVMVVGDTNTKFETSALDGVSPKVNGGNVVLRMNNNQNSTYGQLYIEGLSQSNITGYVDKEYRERKHGTYQQVGFPFFAKTIQSLESELKSFNGKRWSQNEALIWNNAKARFDLMGQTTAFLGTEYFALGSLNFNAAANPLTNIVNPNKTAGNTIVPNYTNGVYVVRGRPIAVPNGQRLYGAALDINFGTSGQLKNYYQETYNSYLQDNFDMGANPWLKPNFGRNLYQFSNPYFTNLDLINIGRPDAGLNGDLLEIPHLQGIRFDPGVVATDSDGATYSEGAKYLTFENGIPTGDVYGALIKPMQTFVVKLTKDAANTDDAFLKFERLRRFAYTTRASDVNYDVTAAKGSSSSTVKQLGVIALDANGKEMGRTYYVVSTNANTGVPALAEASSQITASNLNVIGTYEEDKNNGGKDIALADKYWLYINEANEIDFAKKAISLELYSNDIVSLKFEILENAKRIDDNQSLLSTGKEFYIKKHNSSDYITISQGAILPVTTDQYSLYYDKNALTLDVTDASKVSRTKVAYNPNKDNYVLIFDPKWNQADVKVYDMSGKLILSKSKVSTKKDCELDIYKLNGTYIITAKSEKGEVFNGKVIR